MRLCSLRRETHRRPSRHRLPGRHDTTGCRRLLSGICCEPGAKTRYRRVPVIRAQPQIDGGTLVNAELFRSLIRVWRSFRANISPEVSCRRRVSRLPWRHASQAMDTIATMRCAALRFACGHNSQKGIEYGLFHLHKNRLFSSARRLCRSQQSVPDNGLFCLMEGGELQKTIPYGVEGRVIFGPFEQSWPKSLDHTAPQSGH